VLRELVGQLEVAVASRTAIGKALGMVMERLDLDGDQAWAYLSRCSQDRNIRVADLAAMVVATRVMPGAAARQGP
jgi:AmiR/NasT family two-component response regulator